MTMDLDEPTLSRNFQTILERTIAYQAQNVATLTNMVHTLSQQVAMLTEQSAKQTAVIRELQRRIGMLEVKL